MKSSTYYPRRGYTIAAIFLVVIFALMLGSVGVSAYFFSQPGSRHYTCGDFGSYEEALKIFNDPNAHAGYLDRDGDGKPCEYLQ